jgi:hypothetical protein
MIIYSIYNIKIVLAKEHGYTKLYMHFFFYQNSHFALNFDLFFKSQYVSLYNLNICYRYKEKQKVGEVAGNITYTPEEKDEVLKEKPVSCKRKRERNIFYEKLKKDPLFLSMVQYQKNQRYATYLHKQNQRIDSLL